MEEAEGVIKFEPEHSFRMLGDEEAAYVSALAPWRHVLMSAGLLGVDPARYGGLGFGNLSHRIAASPAFVVTGSQTGQVPEAGREHYATIDHVDLGRNRVRSHGQVLPSSETMTHAMLYALDPAIACVFHVHAPRLWHARERLRLPTTRAQVAYGTSDMAAEVARLYEDEAVRACKIIAMAGHEDGIVAFGDTPEEAGSVLLRWHDAARR